MADHATAHGSLQTAVHQSADVVSNYQHYVHYIGTFNCESAKSLFFNVFEFHHISDHGLGNYGNPLVATTTHTCPRHLFVWHRPFGCTKFCSSVHSGGRKKALLAEGADPVTLSPNSWSLSPEYTLFDCQARGEATCRGSAERYISWNRTWNPWSYQS